MNAADLANQNLNTYYLSLGSNIEPGKNMPLAISLLKEHGKVGVTSSVWRSAAMGVAGPEFLNSAIAFFSTLKPSELKSQVLREIEVKMGRVRTMDKNAPRPIDIDILIYGSEELDANIWELAHLAVPLAEIHPDFRHVVTGELIKDKAQSLIKRGDITPEFSIRLA